MTDAVAKTWHTIGMKQEFPRQNRFLGMKFYEFAAISMLVLAFFPISLVVSWIAFGTQTTRELIEAMIKDWLQTMLIIVGLIIVSLGGLIWGFFAWLT
jgi:mannose/fructose/N-acetylgalactosamine-specific phosphotransferase system component IIC